MKTYQINQLCMLNIENPTPIKECIDIAVNIVPVEKNDTFENFILAINNVEQCCECFGIIQGIQLDAPMTLFIESIDVDVDLPQSILDQYYPYGEYFAVRVNFSEHDSMYFAVYNYHNGYYAHTIYHSSDELKIDVYETDVL